VHAQFSIITVTAPRGITLARGARHLPPVLTARLRHVPCPGPGRADRSRTRAPAGSGGPGALAEPIGEGALPRARIIASRQPPADQPPVTRSGQAAPELAGDGEAR